MIVFGWDASILQVFAGGYPWVWVAPRPPNRADVCLRIRSTKAIKIELFFYVFKRNITKQCHREKNRYTYILSDDVLYENKDVQRYRCVVCMYTYVIS